MTGDGLVSVREAGRRVHECETALARAQGQRDNAVRDAVAGGAQLTVVARATGLSRQRVAQIVAAT